METINFQQLIQSNSKEKLTAQADDLRARIATESDTYLLREQLKQHEIALAWEPMNEHQQQQIALYNLEKAKREMKQIKVKIRRKKSRDRAECKRQKAGIIHIAFPEVFCAKDQEFQFKLTGVKDLDTNYKGLYGKECPKGFFRKLCVTSFAEVIEFKNELFQQEYLAEHPRANTVVGRTGVEAYMAKLVNKHITETSLIKGFRLRKKGLYRIRDSRTAMGNPDSQLPLLYTTMKRNWK